MLLSSQFGSGIVIIPLSIGWMYEWHRGVVSKEVSSVLICRYDIWGK